MLSMLQRFLSNASSLDEKYGLDTASQRASLFKKLLGKLKLTRLAKTPSIFTSAPRADALYGIVFTPLINGIRVEHATNQAEFFGENAMEEARIWAAWEKRCIDGW